MGSTQLSNDTATEASGAAAVAMRLELAISPVAAADRAKAFYGDAADASFTDPDGNEWLLQEITERLPGREWED